MLETSNWIPSQRLGYKTNRWTSAAANTQWYVSTSRRRITETYFQLNVLNDDCFHEIFNKLNFPGLFSVANVCTRFNQIAKQVFASKYRSRMINSTHLHLIRFLIQVENVLSNFGSFIVSLEVDPEQILDNNTDDETKYNLSNSILTMIGAHCRNLNELIINFLRLDEQTLIRISSLLLRLKTLRLRTVTNGSARDVISKCSQLEVLDYCLYSHYDIDLPNVTLPNLVEFRFNPNKYKNIPSLIAFLACNSHLKILEMCACSFDSTNIFDHPLMLPISHPDDQCNNILSFFLIFFMLRLR